MYYALACTATRPRLRDIYIFFAVVVYIISNYGWMIEGNWYWVWWRGLNPKKKKLFQVQTYLSSTLHFAKPMSTNNDFLSWSLFNKIIQVTALLGIHPLIMSYNIHSMTEVMSRHQPIVLICGRCGRSSYVIWPTQSTFFNRLYIPGWGLKRHPKSYEQLDIKISTHCSYLWQMWYVILCHMTTAIYIHQYIVHACDCTSYFVVPI